MTRFAPRFNEELAVAPLTLVADLVAQPDRGVAARPAPWTRVIIGRLLVADAVSALIAVAAGFGVRVGFDTVDATSTYLSWGCVVAVAWLITLWLQDAYDLRRVITGTGEFQRVLRAGATLIGLVAVVCYLADMVVGRTFVAIVIPVGVLLMALSRLVLRRAVYARRRNGEWTSSILAVGTRESVQHLAEQIGRVPEVGLTVVGACVEDAEIGDEILPGVPVVGSVLEAAEAAERQGVDVVAVAGSGLGPRRIRELGWALEGTGRNMVMAPGLTEVAGPRVHVSPVDGLPLMWVDQPQFTGATRLVKRFVDIVLAGAGLLVISPVLLLIAAAVRLTSRGPAIYRSTRVGAGGREFTVYKFRSMHRDAETRRAALLESNEVGGDVLFKMRRDPRVTAVGRVIRAFSLDELPQLLNVLRGSMSLVGPRPPLPEEVERYADDAHRRMLVKPGLTGLWQVSGRSDLSWDEAVRLDLYYVENWSLSFDFAIIARTAWAVLARRGAY